MASGLSGWRTKTRVRESNAPITSKLGFSVVAPISVMVAGGQSRGRAIGAAAILGVATVLGVLLTEEIGPLARHGLALSGGVTLYVAASNLVPEFQAKRGWLSGLAFVGGAVGFFLTELLLEGWLR